MTCSIAADSVLDCCEAAVCAPPAQNIVFQAIEFVLQLQWGSAVITSAATQKRCRGLFEEDISR